MGDSGVVERASVDSGAGSRPADVARRALRAARARGTTRGSEAGDEYGTPAAPGGARPGDVAREALRRAVNAEAATLEEPEGERKGTPSGAERSDAVSPAGARPGDIAREALRAARAAERARAETEAEVGAKGAVTSRRTADRGSIRSRARQETRGRGDGREGGRGADRGGGRPTRDVHELLAGAFRLPPDDAPTDAPSAKGTDIQRAVAAHAGSAAKDDPPPDYSARPHAHDVPGTYLSDGSAHSRSHHVPGTHPPDDSARPRAHDAPGTAAPDTPTTPRVPRTMAAPSRDGELRRTFPAFPPRPSGGEAFAESWWGNAWVSALEEGALDAARLARGRAYADKGHVDAITVTPGLVLAYVHGSRPRPYRVQIRVRTLDDTEWDRLLDAAAERPGRIAALLDKQLPQALADTGPRDAGDTGDTGTRAGPGVRLLPGPGELDPHCSCPDFGHPCKHAAALCYQTARLLDEDPFVLLLLRGRGERQLLDALSRRSATRAARAAQDGEPQALPGVRARDALAPRTLPPLPAPLPPPPHPEQPPVYPGAPGGPDPFALDQLATDAAARAHALLTTGRDPVAELTLWQDAVRLAAARPGSGLTATTRALYSSLAAATGRTPADLARAVAAWRQGGLEGLTVLEEPWDPPAGRFDRARPLLLAADLPAFRPWRNHLTHPFGHVQLRLGRDGLWYAYESEPGQDDWWPRGTPDLDPVGALTGLGEA
ncbi:SWIM zinc finger family protein [Streptomyces ipomoeae]|uniref:SWIM zinc finger family protein n=1 Tax=Streptomyces ipomoeae TaxID=103232 RepID=UPI000A30F6A5|nr:SWIM zinc finger family protein [Streptomyces ipomoeae]